MKRKSFVFLVFSVIFLFTFAFPKDHLYGQSLNDPFDSGTVYSLKITKAPNAPQLILAIYANNRPIAANFDLSCEWSFSSGTYTGIPSNIQVVWTPDGSPNPWVSVTLYSFFEGREIWSTSEPVRVSSGGGSGGSGDPEEITHP